MTEYEHDLYKTGDKDAHEAIEDRNGEVVLQQCRKCGLGESELDDHPYCQYPNKQPLAIKAWNIA